MNSIPLKEKDALKGAGKFLTSLYRYKIIIGAYPETQNSIFETHSGTVN
jgi:hypothetical protein